MNKHFDDETNEISFKSVTLSPHCFERTAQRKVTSSQVRDVVANYTHITPQGNDEYLLSKLVSGRTLYVAVCINSLRNLLVKTCYWHGDNHVYSTGDFNV